MREIKSRNLWFLCLDTFDAFYCHLPTDWQKTWLLYRALCMRDMGSLCGCIRPCLSNQYWDYAAFMHTIAAVWHYREQWLTLGRWCRLDTRLCIDSPCAMSELNIHIKLHGFGFLITNRIGRPAHICLCVEDQYYILNWLCMHIYHK